MRELSDVDLSDDELQLQSVVRSLATNELDPMSPEAHDTPFSDKLRSRLAALGLFGLTVPTEHGGLGATRVQSSIVLEEMATANAGAAMTLMAHIHATSMLSSYASADLRAAVLPHAANGERLLAVAFTEPDAGSDLASIRTRAEPSAAGYTLNGVKTFITNGDRADQFIVLARVASAVTEDQLSLFVVDATTPGVLASTPFVKLGLHSSTTTEVSFDHVSVPAENLVGEHGAGLNCAKASLVGARMSTAAQAVGLAGGAFAAVFGYATQRQQAGIVIARHQAVQIRLAEMQIQLCAARSLLYQVARNIDRGGSGLASAAVAKTFCTDTAMTVASAAVEVAGGYGYMEESGLPRFLRDARGGAIYDGTNDINRLLIVRELLRSST